MAHDLETSSSYDQNWPPSVERLERLIETAIVDAYGEEEQCVGLFTMLQDNLDLPFDTEVLGVSVTVEGIDLTLANEIVAICRRGGRRQAIPILNLQIPSPPPPGGEWIEAYRHLRRSG